jgi:hypothetical protein
VVDTVEELRDKIPPDLYDLTASAMTYSGGMKRRPDLAMTLVGDPRITGVRWFAEHQPVTPIIDTVRALLAGTPVGNDGIVAVIWCVALTVVGVLWSRAAFDRLPNR